MTTAPMDHPDDPGGGPAPAHDHPPFLAHHFETPKQQFEAGKLGMWIFLVTEILLFGGLFCAYAVYRSNHPEIFQYAQQFLDTRLGALNTGVLIFSSLTMAWAVRCAQLGQRRALIALLSITLACACVFLGVKYVEYRHKWHDGLLWAGWYSAEEHGEGEQPAGQSLENEAEGKSNHADEPTLSGSSENEASDESARGESEHGASETSDEGASETREDAGLEAGGEDESPDELGAAPSAEPEAAPSAKPLPAPGAAAGHPEIVPRHVGVFFSIYFLMTGLHGLHVIAGMAAITWILVRSVKGHFGPSYFGPVDYVGLYWHLVDMIWIYLFPLLYLIHEAPGH